LHAIQSAAVARASCLLANSRFTCDRIHQSFGVVATFCPLGVDLDMFRPLPDVAQEDFVLSVGELSPRKGFDFLIKSLASIPAGRRPSLKLACNAIEPDERRYVEDLAIRSAVDLDILVSLDADRLRVLHNRARFCVYAPVAEPFGLVPLEAMACGRAVVAVREGGVQETFSTNRRACWSVAIPGNSRLPWSAF
jgi:glycosyltransferase involved in cell wall biosynthesis